jgi:hypothetical protein
MADNISPDVKTNPDNVVTTNVAHAESAAGPNEKAASATNNELSRSAVKTTGFRPLKLEAEKEEHVRELMARARKFANGGGNTFNSEADVKDLAQFANNLVQLMNAAWIVSFLNSSPDS